MPELPSSLQQVEWLILDMDGVLTSESAYWDTAGLVIRDILESPAHLALSPPDYTPIANIFYHRLNQGARSERRKYLPPSLIKRCKARGINSNWDLAYLVCGLYLTQLFYPFSSLHRELTNIPAEDSWIDESSPDSQETSFRKILAPIWNRLQETAQKDRWNELLHLQDFHLWGEWFRSCKCTIAPVNQIELRIMDDFHPEVRGLHLLSELNQLIDQEPVHRLPLFGRQTPLWDELRDLFQQFYLGEELYLQTYGEPILYTPKSGLIHGEEPLHGLPKTHATLSKLQNAGYRLGISTGRPRMEILTPLQKWDVLKYFETDHIVTHDEVEDAERELQKEGITESLGKPHPFSFLRAINPEWTTQDVHRSCNTTLPEREKVMIVGDAMADIWAAKKIDCPCAALLSGALGESSRREIETAHPDLVCCDLLELTDILVSK